MLGGRVRLSLRVMVCGTGSEWVGPRHHRGTAMEHFAGIDVSLKDSSICVIDAAGRIVREAKVASEPEALVAWFRGLGFAVTRIGLEAGVGLGTPGNLTIQLLELLFKALSVLIS